MRAAGATLVPGAWCHVSSVIISLRESAPSNYDLIFCEMVILAGRSHILSEKSVQARRILKFAGLNLLCSTHRTLHNGQVAKLLSVTGRLYVSWL